MVRPKKFRFIGKAPAYDYFKPRGVPMRELEEVILLTEEYESIRLSDLEGHSQTECADMMKVSQPTFSRLILTARKKIAEAIVKGKSIRIEGGKFSFKAQRFRCKTCNDEWDVPSGITRPGHCRSCNGDKIQWLGPDNNYRKKYRNRRNKR